MSNGMDDSIKSLLEGDDVPQRVTNQLLMGVILELRREFTDYRKERMDHDLSKEIIDRLENLERETARLHNEMKQHPSILWLIRFEPRKTIATVILIFVILMTIFTISHPLTDILRAYFGF